MPQERPFFPEANNHRIPERGGSRFGVKTGLSGIRRTTTRGKTPLDTRPPPADSATTDIPAKKQVTFDFPPIVPPSQPETPAQTDEERDEARATNRLAYTGSTSIAETIGGNKILRTLVTLGEVLGITGASVGVGYGVYRAESHFFREAPSDFTKHLNNDKPLSVPAVPEQAQKDIGVNPDEIFDNTATKGIKSERNTIWMTREEYEKIAPPMIDRTNVKEVSVTVNIHPQPDGRTTNDLNLELGTTVNAMIYVKTPEGKLRETTYEKIPEPGGIGKGLAGFVFPNCRTLLGLEGEIQEGDIFPAPISGKAYYSGTTVEDPKGETQGKVIIETYIIKGQYYDTETNKTFESTARVNLSYTETEPLIPDLPNINDPAFKEKVKGINSSGKEVEVMMTNKNKMTIVTVQQGEGLFRFKSKPQVQSFSRDFKTKSQLVVSTTYRGVFAENGKDNPFGGENCDHPTIDNKAIVLK